MNQNLELSDVVDSVQSTYKSEVKQPEGKGFLHGLSEVFGRTLEYYTQFIPSKRLKRKLSERCEHYDFDEFKATYDEPFLDTRTVREGFKQGGLLKAYEKFWSCWNKPAQRPIRAVYDALGGSERPVKATMGAFTFSGAVIHGLNPVMLPLYTISAATGDADSILGVWAAIAGFYVLAGIPAAISKWKQRRSSE